LRYFNQKSSR